MIFGEAFTHHRFGKSFPVATITWYDILFLKYTNQVKKKARKAWKFPPPLLIVSDFYKCSTRSDGE